VRREASEDAIEDVLAMAHFAVQRGWVPATSGNFSRRIDESRTAITRTGADKNSLVPGDVMIVGLNESLPAGVSAETPLHVARYRRHPAIQAIMHVHSLNSTVLSRQFAASGAVTLRGYEMNKALAGFTTHDCALAIPIFANSQDTCALAEEVESSLREETVPGYLIAGHGLYAWGESASQACRHAEALDFLLACALEEWRRR